MDPRATFSVLLLLLVGLCCAQEGKEQLPDDDTSEDIILKMNKGSSDNLLEGDLFISKKRNAMKCVNKVYSCLWEKSSNGLVEVPFVISEKYDDSERTVLLGAMKGFADNTCIRFIPRSEQRAYVSLEPKFGCFSLLGRIGEKQVVSLQRFGCMETGVIQHELMHTLGFYHEHTRSDRDKHVKINWENIADQYKINFKKKDGIFLNTAYDYGSVMHYGRTGFGTKRSETITPIPDASVAIGQRKGMSKTDIVRLNRLYKC